MSGPSKKAQTQLLFFGSHKRGLMFLNCVFYEGYGARKVNLFFVFTFHLPENLPELPILTTL